MSDSHPTSSLPPEWLAAYVDGELSADQLAQIEMTLANDSAAATAIEAQSQFSPRNEEFWKAVQPTTPSELAWTRVFNAIELALDPVGSDSTPVVPSQYRNGRRLTGILLALGVSLACLMILILQPPPASVRTEVVQLPDWMYAKIDLASEDEVRIVSLDESASSGLVVGRHPLLTSPILLASFDEVDLHGIEPNEDGEFPEVQMTPHGATSPMIWVKTSTPGPR